MWIVHLFCSDETCAEEIEVVVSDLAEADQVGCTCGNAFVLATVSEVEVV
jgi:hypothetical protein